MYLPGVISCAYAVRVTRGAGRGRPYGQHLGTETEFSHDGKRERCGRTSYGSSDLRSLLRFGEFLRRNRYCRQPRGEQAPKKENHMAVFRRSLAFTLRADAPLGTTCCPGSSFNCFEFLPKSYGGKTQNRRKNTTPPRLIPNV